MSIYPEVLETKYDGLIPQHTQDPMQSNFHNLTAKAETLSNIVFVHFLLLTCLICIFAYLRYCFEF